MASLSTYIYDEYMNTRGPHGEMCTFNHSSAHLPLWVPTSKATSNLTKGVRKKERQ